MAEVEEVIDVQVPVRTNGNGGGDLERYYNYLKQKGADVPPTYQSFHSTLQNEQEAKKYYDYVKSKGYDAPPTFESFSNTLGLKKKDTPQVSAKDSKTTVSQSKNGGQLDPAFSPSTALLGRGTQESSLQGLGLPVMNEDVPKTGATPEKRVTVNTPFGQSTISADAPINELTPAIFSSAIQRGLNQGELADMLAVGRTPTSDDIKRIAELQRSNRQLETQKSDAYKKFNESNGFGEAMSAFVSTPTAPLEIITELSLESLSALAKHGATRMALGAAEGAAVGSVIPGLGTATGAGYGMLSGMGMSSLNLEYSGKILETLAESGINLEDEQSLKDGFADEKLMSEARTLALKKGVPVALFDMVSGKIGGKFLPKGSSTVSKKIVAGAKEVGAQSALGGGGEIAGELTAGEELNAPAILGEVFGEVGGGLPDIATGAFIRKAEAGENITGDLLKISKELPKEQRQEVFNETIDISEGIGEVTPEQAVNLKEQFAQTIAADEKIPENVLPEQRVELIPLISEKTKLEEKKSELESSKEKVDDTFHAAIDEEIKQTDKAIKEKKKEVLFILDDKDKSEPIDLPVESQVVPESKVGSVGGDKTFTTHKNEVVTGEKLTDAIDKVADDMVEGANKKRQEHYASHITEKQKDEFLAKDLKYAEEVRQGEHLNNLTIAQRINYELTGESVPILPKEQSLKETPTPEVKVESQTLPMEGTDTGSGVVGDVNIALEKELNELGQKQLTKGFNSLSEATKPEQVAIAIVNIEQNKNQGARLSKEQEQQLSEAKAKLKEQGYEIVDYNIVRNGENTIVQSVDFYDNQKDVLTEEQANAIESKINSLEKRGEEVDVDDLPSPVSRTIKPLIKKDGRMVQSAEVNTLIFESVEQAREAVKKSREVGYKKPNAADKIKAKVKASPSKKEESIQKEEVVTPLKDQIAAIELERDEAIKKATKQSTSDDDLVNRSKDIHAEFDAKVEALKDQPTKPTNEKEKRKEEGLLSPKEKKEEVISSQSKTTTDGKEKSTDSTSEETQKVDKGGDTKAPTTEKKFTEKSKKIAEKIRSFKSKPLELKDEKGNPIIIAKKGIDQNDIIEGIAKLVEAGGQLADAIATELSKHKWYNDLTDKGKEGVRKQFEDHFSDDEVAQETKIYTNEKAIIGHLVDSENISDAARTKLEDNGLKYEPHSHEEARMFATEIVKGVGEDAAVAYAEANRFSGDINSSIFAVAIDRIAAREIALRAKGEYTKADLLAQKWADYAMRYDEAARSGGRFISQVYDFYKKSPLGIKIKEQKIREKAFADWFKDKEGDFKEFWDEVVKQPEFESAVKVEAEKITNKQKAKVIADKIRTGKLDKDISLGSIPFAKQVINGSIEAVALAVEAGGSIADAVEKGVEYMKGTDWYKNLSDTDKPESEVKLKKYLTDLSDKNESPKKRIKKSDEEKIIKKWSDKLKGLPSAKKEQFIREVVKAVVQKGDLKYGDFKKILADAVGLGKITEKESAIIDDYVEAANKVTELGDLAQEKGTPESIRAYDEAVRRSERAATDLANALHQKTNLTSRITSLVSLNTLGFGTLLKNIGYNIAQQAMVRFPKALIGTAFDYTAYGVTLAANKVYGTPIIKPETNVFLAQRGYFKELKSGLKDALLKVRRGGTQRDYFQQGVQQSRIKPMQSWRDLRAWNFGKGDKFLTTKDVVDKLVQGTIGVPAEVISRGLFFGDTPPRWAAEGAKAEQIARLKLGIKDKNEIELFKKFPLEQAKKHYLSKGVSEEKAQALAEDIQKQLKEAGDDATLTMDNIVVDMINSVKQFGEAASQENPTKNAINTIGRVFGVLNVPYLKIPINAAWLAMNLRNPLLPLVQSAWYGYHGIKSNDPSMIRKSKDWLYVAGVGVSLNAVAAWMVANGIITPEADEDDDKKERDASNEFSRQNSLNMDKLLRGGGETKDGDVNIDLSWFGAMGTLMNVEAQQSQKEMNEQMTAMDKLAFNMTRGGIDGFTSNVFGGTNALINAYSMGGGYVNQLGLQYFNLLANIFEPAMLTQASRYGFSRQLDVKGDDLGDAISKEIYQRTFGLMGTKPETKLGIFGTPQEKGGSYLGRLAAGMTGTEQIDTDKMGYVIYDLYNKSNNAELVPPAIPKTISVDGKQQPLNYQQQRELTQLIGQSRLELVAAFLDNKAALYDAETKKWEYIEKMDMNQISGALKSMYDKGGDLGRDKFKIIHPEFQSTNKKTGKPTKATRKIQSK